MLKRDIKKVAKMASDGLSSDLCLRVLISLCIPTLPPDDVDHLATSIIDYNNLMVKYYKEEIKINANT